MGSQPDVHVVWGILIAIVVLLCQCTSQVSAGDIPQSNDGVTFDYEKDGPRGPARWGDLKSAWAQCKRGVRQSPMFINADNMVTDPRLGKLDAKYTSKCVPTNISNDGHEVELTVPASAGVLKINNVVYRPAQMHFHMPSEHKILSHTFPLEMHMVHLSKDSRIAVIAWLFTLGEDSPFLAQFIDKLPSNKNPNVQTKIAPIKLPKLERSYGRYEGSLTTPPCLEKVTWTVMLWNFPTVSKSQLKKMKAAMPQENARPSVPCHGRKFRINSKA
ncbi:hypothetical protein KC19_8G123700 [Ceratodon purpureus]|uniref:Carbonic anhydrase n=1 Tax=Ceratodon purpureus TaxID=3225 RepID=A0A8T0H2M6_CERPU|nr:hypothetical protein KC19_8G123700 [Ceratodon purpureus]